MKRWAPPQQNLQTALLKALEALKGQPPLQLEWLGAGSLSPSTWSLAVMGDRFVIDVASGAVLCSTGQEVGLPWKILALHYLGIRIRPPAYPPEVSFADLASGRTYASVYQARVIQRLCAKAGRDLPHLREAALGVHAQSRACGTGDAAFDLAVFPRITLRLVWYAPDEEFAASAVLLMPRNIESFLCAEDITVLSEGVVSRMCGRPF